jgi:hypothetical protein
MFDLNRQYLLVSSLQKSIRWCEINASRYFAQELMKMGVPGVAIHRLLLIAAEDVGLADPTLLIYVRSCLDAFENSIKRRGIKKQDAYKFPNLCDIVDQAAIAAAISYKSRLLAMSSFATLYEIHENEDFSGKLPTYLDRFAKAVESKDEKQALYCAYVAGLFFNSMDRILAWISRQSENPNYELAKRWVDEYKIKPELLVLTGSIALLCRNLPFTHGEFKDAIGNYIGTPITKAPIPDRAYDRHTDQGKRMGRGLHHFFKAGATIKNERFTNNWQQAGETACYRAERIGVLGTEKIIKAINEKSLNSKAFKPFTF